MKLAKISLLVLGAVLPAAVNATKDDMKNGNCAYNMYMCCWTENDGQGMQDNTDVCYVDGEFITKEEQVDTHCHGFAWQDEADHDTYIAPLHEYVKNFDHRDQRGYYGRIKGGRQCGCTEDMPIVERADCTTIDRHGNFEACPGNDLYKGYKQQGLDHTKTAYPPNPNRDGDCHGAAYACGLVDTPEDAGHFYKGGGDTVVTSSTTSDYIDGKGYIREGETFAPTPVPTTADERSEKVYNCHYNMYMCCWTANDGNGMEDNTDVCYVDGKYISEHDQVDTHCHGFAWKNGADYETYKKPLYDYVRTYDHKGQRGYYGRIEGGRQCGCVEDMPVVERADCTTISEKNGQFEACPGNDLMNQYVKCGRPAGFWTPNPSAWGSCSAAETAADKYTADENKGHHKEGGGRTDLTSDSTSYMNSKGEWVRGEDFKDYTYAPSPASYTDDSYTTHHTDDYYTPAPTPAPTTAPTGAPTPAPMTAAPITVAPTTAAPTTAAPTTAAPVPAAAKPEETPSPSEEAEYSYVFDYFDETPAPTYATAAPVPAAVKTEETPCPSEEAEAHPEPTPAPTDETPCPSEEAEAHPEPTPAPTDETPCPSEEAEAHPEPTPAPTDETPCPSEEAEAHPEPTPAPTDETPCPSEEAEAHPEPTPAPTDETPCPSEEAEAHPEPTPAPTDETPCPSEEAEAHPEPTPAPTDETPCPSEEAEAHPEPTPAPTDETPCPSEEAAIVAHHDYTHHYYTHHHYTDDDYVYNYTHDDDTFTDDYTYTHDPHKYHNHMLRGRRVEEAP